MISAWGHTQRHTTAVSLTRHPRPSVLPCVPAFNPGKLLQALQLSDASADSVARPARQLLQARGVRLR